MRVTRITIKTKNYFRFLLLLFVDFNDTTSSPQSCGYDENSGEDKICCEDYGGIPVIGSQPPKFPSKNLKARPCLDHTKQCTKWVQKYPESCKPGHKSYIFMREACQESCGRCKNDVIFYHWDGISLNSALPLNCIVQARKDRCFVA